MSYFVPIKGYFPINLKFGYLTMISKLRFFYSAKNTLNTYSRYSYGQKPKLERIH